MTAADEKAFLTSSSCFQVRYFISDLFNRHVLIAPTCVCWCVWGTRTLCGASCSRWRPLCGGPWPFNRGRSLLSWRTGGGGWNCQGVVGDGDKFVFSLSLYLHVCLLQMFIIYLDVSVVKRRRDLWGYEEEEYAPPLPLRLSDIMFSLCPFVRHVLVIISPGENLITSLKSPTAQRWAVQQDETPKRRRLISRRSKVKVTVTSSRSGKKHFSGRYATAWASLKADPPHSVTWWTLESHSQQSEEWSSRQPLSCLW